MNKLEQGIYYRIRDINDQVIHNILDNDLDKDLISAFTSLQDAFTGLLLEAARPATDGPEITEENAGLQLILYAMGMVELNVEAYADYLAKKDPGIIYIRNTVLFNKGFANPHTWASMTIDKMLADPEEALRFVEPISYCNSELDIHDSLLRSRDVKNEIENKGFINLSIQEIYERYIKAII